MSTWREEEDDPDTAITDKDYSLSQVSILYILSMP